MIAVVTAKGTGQVREVGFSGRPRRLFQKTPASAVDFGPWLSRRYLVAGRIFTAEAGGPVDVSTALV